MRIPIFVGLRAFILDENAGVDRANEFVGERKFPLIGEMLVRRSLAQFEANSYDRCGIDPEAARTHV